MTKYSALYDISQMTFWVVIDHLRVISSVRTLFLHFLSFV